ncbi:hypothetical protein [Paraburkholderia bannensis]|uniref:hypothetical protein n=1 Tax=Paraburkholderia bannensis TaxID=765414 RepID=UPI0012EB26B1|nr:hypothetical protein [Paraburkholderia bannensis]
MLSASASLPGHEICGSGGRQRGKWGAPRGAICVPDRGLKQADRLADDLRRTIAVFCHRVRLARTCALGFRQIPDLSEDWFFQSTGIAQIDGVATSFINRLQITCNFLLKTGIQHF